MKFPRGSEWRKWDLHVHTPESILNRQYTNWDSFVRALFTKAIAKGIAGIGITDYFFVDGYRKLKSEYLADRERLEKLFAPEITGDPNYLTKIDTILLIPNLELRLDTLVPTKGDGATKRLNLHILFAEDVTPAEIESDFIANLQFMFSGGTENQNARRSLTRNNLIALGERLKKQHQPFQGSDDLLIGCMNVTVDDKDVYDLLEKSDLFRARHLKVIAEENTSLMSWNGQAHQTRKVLLQECDMLFSSSPKTVELTRSSEFEAEFGRTKPCVWGSDAHSESALFEVAEDRHCWIKADLSFAGLKQLTNEPTRVHLGPLPPGRASFDDRPWIQSLSIQRNPTTKLEGENWFADLNLPLNRDLVAIIGNKGSGKTALVDVLALVGNSQVQSSYFGFLNENRFKKDDVGRNRAAEFTASIQWNSGYAASKSLKETTKPDAPELVTYLPQGYLEHICSEAGAKAAEDFEKEIERVIFSHVSEADRLGKDSLNALNDYQTAEIKQAMSTLKSQIRDCNRRFCDLQGKQSHEALALLNQQIANKEQEIAHLEQQKLAEVKSPAPPPGGQEDPRLTSLAALRAELGKKDESLQIAHLDQKNAKARLAVIAKLLTSFATFRAQHQAFLDGIQDDMAMVGLSPAVCVNLVLDTAPLEAARATITARTKEIELDLDEKRPESLAGVRKRLGQDIAQIEGQLQGPQREFEAYTKALNEWKEKMKSLVGTADLAGSLEYLKAQKIYLTNTLPGELAALRAERVEKVHELHNNLRRQVDIRSGYYRPIDKFIKESSLVQEYPAGRGHLSSRVCLEDSGARGNRWERRNWKAKAPGGSRRVGDGGARMMPVPDWPRRDQAECG